MCTKNNELKSVMSEIDYSEPSDRVNIPVMNKSQLTKRALLLQFFFTVFKTNTIIKLFLGHHS